MNVLFTQRFIFTQKSRILTQLEEFKKGNLIWFIVTCAGLLLVWSLKRKGTAKNEKHKVSLKGRSFKDDLMVFWFQEPTWFNLVFWIGFNLFMKYNGIESSRIIVVSFVSKPCISKLKERWLTSIISVFMVSTYIYIYLACLFVCMFVCTPKSVKKAEPIWPKFCVGPYVAQVRFMNDQNFKNLPPTKFDFKNPRNFFRKSANFFCFVLQSTHRDHLHTWNRRWKISNKWTLWLYRQACR